MFFVCLCSIVFVSCGLIILDIFSYSGPSGMLGSNGKHTTASAGAGRREIVHAISSHQHSIKPSLLFSNFVASLYF